VPRTSRYLPEGAEVRFSGTTTGDEIFDAKAEFLAHGFPEGPRFALFDFSAVDVFQVTPDDVRRIVELDRQGVTAHPQLAIVVVAPKPLQYGLARMWEIHLDDTPVRTAVLHTRLEALQWLASAGFGQLPDVRDSRRDGERPNVDDQAG
jgi:hypothetical protein